MDQFDTYDEYRGEAEQQIYSDLLFSKEAYEFTQSLGMDGMKLWLEGGVELKERNSRFVDAGLSWRIGVNEMAKTIAATATAMERDTEFIGGGDAGDPMISKFRFTMPSKLDSEASKKALYKFDEEINARIFELSQRQTQYALDQKQLDRFGPNAMSNEILATEEYASILNESKRNLAFAEGPLLAVQSMPLSYSAMAVGLIAAPLTGGGSLVASITTGGLIGLGVSSRTFYDSYKNPLFYTQEDGTIDWNKPTISETERHGMATLHGLSEGGGEFLGMMTTMGIGKFIAKPGSLSPYSIFKDLPTKLGVAKYSTGRKFIDFGMGLVAGSALGATEEYVAEGGTGVMGMFIDSKFSGVKYTDAQYIERFHKDGKIGAWAGLPTGGGAVVVSTARANYERVFRPETFNERAAQSYYHQLTNSGFFMNKADKATRKELNKQLQVIGKTTAKGGILTDLTKDQKSAIKKINELIADLNISKNRDIKILETFAAEGRYDLLAEMVQMDNDMLFLEATSNFISSNLI